jgi:hypothetical protein
VRPLHLAAEQLPEMTEGQVNVHGGDDHRRERVQDEGGQGKHSAEKDGIRRFI